MTNMKPVVILFLRKIAQALFKIIDLLLNKEKINTCGSSARTHVRTDFIHPLKMTKMPADLKKFSNNDR